MGVVEVLFGVFLCYVYDYVFFEVFLEEDDGDDVVVSVFCSVFFGWDDGIGVEDFWFCDLWDFFVW